MLCNEVPLDTMELTAPDTCPLKHRLTERSGCLHGVIAAVMQALSLGRGVKGGQLLTSSFSVVL